MTKDATGRRTAGWAAVLPWAIGGTVLAGFLALACGSYYIHSTSDPHNWLGFARNFAEEFGKSRWPYGYPLYLRTVMAAVGPYWVFLANLPALLGVFAMAGWIGSLSAREDRTGRGGDRLAEVPRSWGFLAVWVVVMGANSGMLRVYVNPFRDPPSYFLLLASVGVFVRSLEARRMWGVGAAGALLGLACSVREPSVLMLLPLFAYGLLAWRSGRPGLKLWSAVGAFALGMGLGVAPMLVQSYLSTHQVLVPHNLILNVPETQEESKLVPGMYFTGTRLARVAGMAYPYYWNTEKAILFLAAVGLVAAVWRRNRLVLAVVAPAAVGYAAFYTFYRIFVPRYFYVSVLFFALLAGYGLLSLLRLCAKIRPPLAGRIAGWLLLAAVACHTTLRLLGERPEGRLHQVPQARAMASAIRAICPDASAIYADRPLCEWIDWFLQTESGPVADLIPGNANALAPGGSGALRDTLAPRLERGENLYAAFWRKNVESEVDWPFVRRAFDCLPAGSFDPAPYGAESYADGTVWVYRLASWTNLSTALEWPVPGRGPHGGVYWFMVDAGDWPEGHAPASLAVDGALAAIPSIPHGGTWVGAAEAGPEDAGRTVAATVSSSDPLPRAMAVRTGRLDEPLEMDFRLAGGFDHFWRWSGDIRFTSDLRRDPGVGIRSGADLELPVPRPGLAGAVVELELRSDRAVPDVSIPVGVSGDGRLLVRADVPGDRTPIRLAVPLPFDPGRETRLLHFDVEARAVPESGADEEPVGVECLQAVVHRWPVSWPVTVRLGELRGNLHMLSGFSGPVGRDDAAFRWTTGESGLDVYLPETDEPLVLAVGGSFRGVPQEARGGLRVAWDGAGLSGHLEASGDGDAFAWEGGLPAGAGDGRTPHRIALETTAWRPGDQGSPDAPALGVRVACIEISPADWRPRALPPSGAGDGGVPELDFRPSCEVDHTWRWTGDVHRPSRLRPQSGVHILSGADLELPEAWGAFSNALVALEVRSSRAAPGVSIPVAVSADGRPLARRDVPGDWDSTVLVVPLTSGAGREIRHLHFDVEVQPPPEADPNPEPVGLECLRADIHRWPESYPVSIGIGTSGDGPHALSGFSRREGRGDAACRWTTGSAGVGVYLPACDRPLGVEIAGSLNGIPGAARGGFDSGLHVTWDGTELPGQLEWKDNGDDFAWTGTLPAGSGDGRTPHRLGIETPSWRPAAYGIPDARTLGVRIGRIGIAPVE